MWLAILFGLAAFGWFCWSWILKWALMLVITRHHALRTAVMAVYVRDIQPFEPANPAVRDPLWQAVLAEAEWPPKIPKAS